MKVRFLKVAREELREAVRFYNSRKSGLGAGFKQEVNAALALISDFPEAWHPLSARTRRCMTNRFPYGIIYQIREDEILVVAVAHLHREPEYWADRT